MDPLTTAEILTIGSEAANIGANVGQDWASRAWQEEMWNKQNEYNLPVNQVQRLKDAGINPNLAFGSSASALGTNVPGVPSTSHFDLGKGVERYYEKKSVLASIKLQQENARREQLNNDLLESLLDDKKRAELEKLRWDIDHYYDYMNDKMIGQEVSNVNTGLRNQILNLEIDIKDAKRKQEWTRVKMLETERDHLIAKYGYEDYYYNQKLNPYETSTWAGLIRSVLGLTQDSEGRTFDWFKDPKSKLSKLLHFMFPDWLISDF